MIIFAFLVIHKDRKILKENKEIECLILGERTFLDVEK
jgi:hypothetical protein